MVSVIFGVHFRQRTRVSVLAILFFIVDASAGCVLHLLALSPLSQSGGHLSFRPWSISTCITVLSSFMGGLPAFTWRGWKRDGKDLT